MPSLPVISGGEAVRALQRLGFTVVRQRGSHIVLRKGTQGCVVPNHREIKTGTLAGLLKQGGVSIDDFINAFIEGLRSLGVGRHIIFYRFCKTEIEVARILHKRMDVTRHFGGF